MNNFVLNLSPKDYYTQRNNSIKPWSACMPTSFAMFLRGNKIPFRNESDMQDDDYFMKLLNSDDACEFALKKYPWSKGIPPNEIHGMYGSYLSPIVCSRRISDFKTDLTYDDYINRLKSGQVIMTSGAFPKAGLHGHAFCTIGIISNHNIRLLIADPWGNYRTNYNRTQGYNIIMPKDDFYKHIKPTDKDKKWGHVLIEDNNNE